MIQLPLFFITFPQKWTRLTKKLTFFRSPDFAIFYTNFWLFQGFQFLSDFWSVLLAFTSFFDKLHSFSIKKKQRAVVETCLMLIFGFFSYYLSEYWACSGLTSLFCFVAVFTNYSQKLISDETNLSIDSLLKTANYLCESVAFLYLGFISIYILIDGSIMENCFVSMFLIFGIALIRWISIAMPAFGLICSDNIRIEINEIGLIWFSGLIRGSVSVALSFLFTDENQKLRCIVLLVSLFTSIGVTTFSKDIIRKLGFIDALTNGFVY